MRLVHLSHTDSGAGAGRAAYRIHRSLIKLGCDSTMLVSQKSNIDPTVEAVSGNFVKNFFINCSQYLEARYGSYIALNQNYFFSPTIFNWYQAHKSKVIKNADIVSIYWINGAFISPEIIGAINKPIVWRLSDIWPFTGGCHYPGGCNRFENTCGNCPQLKKSSKSDLSRKLMKRKLISWKALNLTVVAPSNWIAKLASKSTLFKERNIVVIPTGIDLKKYFPINKKIVRSHFGIKINTFVILFGAMDPTKDKRKGYNLLVRAFNQISNNKASKSVTAVIFGSDKPITDDIKLKCHSLGKLKSDIDLNMAYNSADLVVVPSIEDNLPNVALEAIACGTPVVAFDVCGMPDIIIDGWNGRLAKQGDSTELGEIILSLIKNTNKLIEMKQNCRIHAINKFSIEKQAISFKKLYQEIINNE